MSAAEQGKLIPIRCPRSTPKKSLHVWNTCLHVWTSIGRDKCLHQLTVDLTAVGATVEKDAGSLRTAVVDLIFVDFDIVAALGGDDAMVLVVVDLVVGDGEVVRVVVGVETVLVVIVHLVVRPHTTLQREESERKCVITALEAHTIFIIDARATSYELRERDRRTGTLYMKTIAVKTSLVQYYLVAVRVHAVVHVVNVGVHDITVHVRCVEHLGVALVSAKSADLPGQPVGLRVEPS